jgi:hypothetical protein
MNFLSRRIGASTTTFYHNLSTGCTNTPSTYRIAVQVSKRCLSTQEERKATRDKERVERKIRRDNRAKKDAEITAYWEKITTKTPEQELRAKEEEQRLQEQHVKRQDLEKLWAQQRAEIKAEVKSITRTLYRMCLKSVKLIRPGNEKDEIEFKRLEAEQVDRWKQSLIDSLHGIGSLAPPVDRQNELESRYNYYLAHVLERFAGHTHILDRDPWTEDCVESLIKILRNGEYARQWVLADYKFDDPYSDRFDEKRVIQLEERMINLVKDVYQEFGWTLQSEIEYGNVGDVDEFGTVVEDVAEGKSIGELRVGAKYLMQLDKERASNLTRK